MAANNVADFSRKLQPTTILFALGLLLFLLPFFDIKCNNVTMARLSGISMATGSRPSVSDDLGNMQRSIVGDERGSFETKTEGDGHLFITALAALLLGAVGLLLSLTNKGRNQRPAMLVGGLAAVALLASWIDAASFVSRHAESPSRDDFGGGFAVKVSTSPTFWYFLSLLSFATAAYILYKQNRVAITGNEPPANAPQIKIGNPGDQSEFPASPPTEDRGLG